jgi:hypothetical protein
MALQRSRHHWTAVGGALALIGLIGSSPQAHKAITSPYNYNQHIFPILRDRCSACHFEGGPTPMSLMSHKDAVPWAQSMTEHLIGERMPPWFVDPTGPAVRGGNPLTNKELDTLITWAVGGTPVGDINADPPAFSPPALDWKAGPPDLEIKMEKPHALGAGTVEQDVEFTLNTGVKDERWVKTVDLLPGDRSVVRDAVISIADGPVLAAWVPGYDPVAPPSGVAFRLPPGAKLRLQMHYKKNWQDEQNVKEDRSTVGLYFTEAPLSGKSVEALRLDGPAAQPGGENGQPRTVSGTLAAGGRVVAIRPMFDQAYATVAVDAVAPAGRRVPLLRLRAAQPQWHRRYWLMEPIELPKGSKIEVVATPLPPDDFGIAAPKRYPFQVAVEHVAP